VSVQKRKYPRTFHVPWSEGQASDDKTLDWDDLEEMFASKDVVVTEKLDGENTTIYSTGLTHARSVSSGAHPARTWVRALAARIGPDLPEGWRLVGENVYAQHSIRYTHLPSYFILFGVIDDQNIALAWDDVEEWAELLEIPAAPVIWRGPWTRETVKRLARFRPVTSAYGPVVEGYVVRDAGAFPMEDFSWHAAKYVRRGHVQTDDHWMYQEVIPNQLAPETRLKYGAM
jgi:hypothetical protein